MNDKELLKNAGKWCIKKRKHYGLSQKKLADLLGVSRETVSAFENGRRNNLSLYYKIMETFKEMEE